MAHFSQVRYPDLPGSCLDTSVASSPEPQKRVPNLHGAPFRKKTGCLESSCLFNNAKVWTLINLHEIKHDPFIESGDFGSERDSKADRNTLDALTRIASWRDLFWNLKGLRSSVLRAGPFPQVEEFGSWRVKELLAQFHELDRCRKEHRHIDGVSYQKYKPVIDISFRSIRNRD